MADYETLIEEVLLAISKLDYETIEDFIEENAEVLNKYEIPEELIPYLTRLENLYLD